MVGCYTIKQTINVEQIKARAQEGDEENMKRKGIMAINIGKMKEVGREMKECQVIVREEGLHLKKALFSPRFT